MAKFIFRVSTPQTFKSLVKRGESGHSPDQLGSQEIPVLHSGKNNISVQPALSTLDLYQDPQTHNSSRTRIIFLSLLPDNASLLFSGVIACVPG